MKEPVNYPIQIARLTADKIWYLFFQKIIPDKFKSFWFEPPP